MSQNTPPNLPQVPQEDPALPVTSSQRGQGDAAARNAHAANDRMYQSSKLKAPESSLEESMDELISDLEVQSQDQPADSVPPTHFELADSISEDQDISGAVDLIHVQVPPSGTAGSRQRRQRRDRSPRILIIGFCLWLLGAWFMSMASAGQMQPPQLMVLYCFISVMAIWPVLRLSQFREAGDQRDNGSADSHRSAGRIFLDWISVNLIFQTVVWPLHINAQWHLSQTWWLSAALASWSLMTGAIIVLGCRSDRAVHRMFAAAMCMLLIVGEPLLGLILSQSWTVHTSPLLMAWDLMLPPISWKEQPWQIQVPMIAAAGVISWVVVVVTRRWGRGSCEPLPPGMTPNSAQG